MEIKNQEVLGIMETICPVHKFIGCERCRTDNQGNCPYSMNVQEVAEILHAANYRKIDEVRKETINALRENVMKTLKECSFEPYISAGAKVTEMQCYEACVQKFESMFDGGEVDE